MAMKPGIESGRRNGAERRESEEKIIFRKLIKYKCSVNNKESERRRRKYLNEINARNIWKEGSARVTRGKPPGWHEEKQAPSKKKTAVAAKKSRRNGGGGINGVAYPESLSVYSLISQLKI